MAKAAATSSTLPEKYRTPLLLALIAAGLAGNYFKLQIFLNIDFLFGSIFAMLALQCFGLGRGIASAALIAGYTCVLWNHPYAVVIMTCEVAAVGWLMARRRVGMVLADTIYWLVIGMPLAYLCYHIVMQVPPGSAYITMTKQAVNGIANALVARLAFTCYALFTRSSQTSYRDMVYNLMAFLVLIPALIMLGISSRTDLATTNRQIRTTLISQSLGATDNVQIWLMNREAALRTLAELAASKSSRQMQSSLEQAKKSDVNFLQIGLLDRHAKGRAFYPSGYEIGPYIGENPSARTFLPPPGRTSQQMLSELVVTNADASKSSVTLLVPVVLHGAYGGQVFGILGLDQIKNYLNKSALVNGSYYTLIDKNGKVILTNRGDQSVLKTFVRAKGTLNHLDKEISQWVPALPPHTPTSERWNSALYLAQSSIGAPAGWKLVLEQPVEPFQRALYKHYTDKLALLFLILLGVLALAELLSRWLVAPLGQLGALTHELPLRLASNDREIVWPVSGVTEAHRLITNFKEMAASLTAQFAEVQQINESLEQRTLELQGERHLLAGTISGTNAGTWEWNIQTGKTLFNERWAEIIGYTLEEISPTSFETWRTFVHPADYLICDDVLARHFRGELDYYDCELRMKHKDGNWVWVLARGKVDTRAKGGAPLLMLGTHQDITRRKQAEIYREMGREVLQILNAPGDLKDSFAGILAVVQNRTGFDAIGIRLEDAGNFPYFAQRGFPRDFLLTENALTYPAKNCELCQSKDSARCLECTCGLVISGKGDPLLTAGGSFWTNDSLPLLELPASEDPRINPRNQCILEGYASFALVPIRSEDSIVGLIQLNDRRKGCFTLDTVELLEGIALHIGAALTRVQSQTTLLASNRRFDLLAEQSRTIAWEVDAMGVYTYISPLSGIILGYRPDEMVGKLRLYDLHPQFEKETYKETLFAVFERGDSYNSMESQVLTKSGQAVWVVSNGIPMLSDEGTLLGYRGSDTDITESKKLREQLHQSQKMESVGQLAGGLAHDFNNLLSIINGYCCLMKMDAVLAEKELEYMERIQAASNRAAELTHSMLAFSRTQVINPKNQNMNLVVSKVGTFVEKIIGDNIRFKTVIKEASLPVFIDDGQIEQVLINLANNARDAMPEGGELEFDTDVHIMDAQSVAVQGFGTPGRYAVITVSDSGTGMNEATRMKIFEPFFTTKPVDKGTGLGLAMVYGIVKQHNGFVDVASRPGQGASFVVYLPIVESGATASYAGADAGVETLGGTETILIAEDNADLREFMRIVLSKLGYRIIVAVDGQDAVDKFKKYSQEIDLIIMDMIMPYKSGKVAYDEIKQIRPGVKALFSSGYSARIIQQQGELGEHAEFISKPVQPALLLKKVREMLAQ
jgi:PAS domain S-box-containing protein